jgi:hypothetical protein
MIDLNRINGGKKYIRQIMGLQTDPNSSSTWSKSEQDKLIKNLKNSYKHGQRPKKP